MNQRNPKLANDLKVVLRAECAAFEQYLKIMEEERKLISDLKTPEMAEELTACTRRREQVSAIMQSLHDERLRLLSVFPEHQSAKLSDLVPRHFHPAEARELMVHVGKLKSLATNSQRRSLEFSQFVNFSLNMVNGILSIVWSASQSVLRAYSRKGAMKESFHPSHSRTERVLKEA